MARSSRRGPTSAKAARRRARKHAGGAEIRQKKVFMYRGYTIEELKEMSLEEFRELLPARARRSLLRGFSRAQESFLRHMRKKEGTIRTHRRDMVIIPEMVDRTIAVHNGKEFHEVKITPDMLGHYLGEFALTRKPVHHTGPGVGATRSSKFMPLK
ncbi:MAG TPA: 30S ribosomal protein S19 [Desulfobacterales bacterium]|nr:30S ribosomal protein S19 [Desulfobacterales bacterium]